jgi:hypothetical protein
LNIWYSRCKGHIGETDCGVWRSLYSESRSQDREVALELLWSLLIRLFVSLPVGLLYERLMTYGAKVLVLLLTLPGLLASGDACLEEIAESCTTLCFVSGYLFQVRVSLHWV